MQLIFPRLEGEGLNFVVWKTTASPTLPACPAWPRRKLLTVGLRVASRPRGQRFSLHS